MVSTEVRLISLPDAAWILLLIDSEKTCHFLWEPPSNIDGRDQSWYPLRSTLDCFSHQEILEFELLASWKAFSSGSKTVAYFSARVRGKTLAIELAWPLSVHDECTCSEKTENFDALLIESIDRDKEFCVSVGSDSPDRVVDVVESFGSCDRWYIFPVSQQGMPRKLE